MAVAFAIKNSGVVTITPYTSEDYGGSIHKTDQVPKNAILFSSNENEVLESMYIQFYDSFMCMIFFNDRKY